MGIFRDMHETRQFDSDWDYRELRRMLSEAISRGYVEQIPVMNAPLTRRTESGFVIRRPAKSIP